MKEQLLRNNLIRNKEMLTTSILDDNIIILKKYNRNDFIITKNNLKLINKKYLQKINYKNQNIIIDCSIFNIFNHKIIQSIENNQNELQKNKLKNPYLILGNKEVKDCFKKIKIILDNYPINININIINYNPICNYFINELNHLIIAYKIKDKKERYSYIYDTVCKELDRRFNNWNLCDFQKNLCIRKRSLNRKVIDDTFCHGCCYTKGRVCPYLKDHRCTIKSIGCKFFTCHYLKKQGINYKPKSFLLIKTFMNHHDIRIINNKIYTPKEETIKLMLKK